MVDVIIPTYNRNQLTQEAIASVLAQSFSDFQIFVADDSSSPPFYLTQETNDSRVKIIRLPKNSGPAAARNFAARQGSSPYIAFLDSDDLWHRDKLKMQLQFLQNNKSFQWIHTNELWYKDDVLLKQKTRHKKQGGFFLERLFKLCLISPSAVLMSRLLFEQSGGFAEQFFVAEDYEYWLRLNFKNEIAYLTEPLTIKRAGKWKQLSSQIEIDRFRVLALHKFYRENKNDTNFYQFFESWKKEILYKTEILMKGAEKYHKEQRAIRYRQWLQVFQKKIVGDSDKIY